MKTLNNLRGKFITFEGNEGSGKSTQSKLFVEYLNNNGIEAVWSREPGGCDSAEEIRKLLLTGSINNWDNITELLLMYASRREHTEKKIKPLLAKGVTVICDRYMDSSLAYQGFGEGVSLDDIKSIRNIVLKDFKPDLTFIFDLSVEVGLQRAKKRGETNRFEDMELQFHNNVKKGFEYVYNTEKERCIKIGVLDKTIENITEELIEKSLDFFNK